MAFMLPKARMQYQILFRNRVIGLSNLENSDPHMGVLSGVFLPEPAYDEVQNVFLQFRQAEATEGKMNEAKLQEYFDARDALDLLLISPDGQVLPVNTTHIDDYLAELGECQVTVWTDDSKAFDHCNKTQHSVS